MSFCAMSFNQKCLILIWSENQKIKGKFFSCKQKILTPCRQQSKNFEENYMPNLFEYQFCLKSSFLIKIEGFYMA